MCCPIIQLTKELISQESISPNDKNCQKILIKRLKKIGFIIKNISQNKTSNFWAIHGQKGKTLAFAGHTDVVPAGKIKNWKTPPFTPIIINEYLYGRGSTDMKGSIAAMIIAVERFIKKKPKHHGRLAFIITSDEEGKATNGTIKIIENLLNNKEKINYCIIGEPSSKNKLGDTIKNGRRGSITAKLTIFGIQGHVAYPDLAKNPIHNSINFLQKLITTVWDNGNNYFQATNMQITNIYSNSIADNVIPGELFIQFNFRFNTQLNDVIIRKTITKMLSIYNFNYKIEWVLSGKPFLSKKSKLITTAIQSVQELTGITPNLSTDGGTSDGRFISKLCNNIIELGPINSTIHAINECINIKDLKKLSLIYERIIELLLI
ncbi:succinyl-diaminopimelate desuccinylase [Candidatus Providencia siddallii]|uniref:Succinyl-diaminopimelate desuccinylase n=1 Tax=Candidatus Providencia siddallii TaxID=1715285 RepID=A0ABM9NNV7_9GAMM